jgi:glyoxylase-like metal-dependent hydrolase (beta-lactamase superfamily II)
MRFVLKTFLYTSCLLSPAQAGTESELTKLADGVYVRIAEPDSNAVANSGVIVLEHGVLVFDTHFTPEAGQQLRKAIEAVTTKPVQFLINSHFHPDHTHGNQVFQGAPYSICSQNTRRDILQRDLPAFNRTVSVAAAQIEKLQKDLLQERDAGRKESIRSQIAAWQQLLGRATRLKILAPYITFEETLNIIDGGREVALRRLGSGHTDGDIVLLLPGNRIVFTGDLFFNRALPNSQDASLLEWTKTLELLLKLDVDRFIPGHGPVGTRRDVEDFLGYLRELRSLVEPGVGRGDALEQVLAELALPARYSGYRFQEFFPANVQKMYAELKALQLAEAAAEKPADHKKPKP